MNDFGTGFSSLSHLQRFPIDVLKIDRSFIRNLSADSSDVSIVGAVIGMADSLRMRVVAEGVETEQQLVVLEEQSCPEAQGYYFSRPLIAEDLTALCGRNNGGKPRDDLSRLEFRGSFRGGVEAIAVGARYRGALIAAASAVGAHLVMPSLFSRMAVDEFDSGYGKLFFAFRPSAICKN